MNKKILSIAAALLAMASVTMTSCNKDDDDTPTTPTQTTQEKLMGNWKNMWSAIDNNLNGVVEASEQTAATDFQAYRFMSGGVLVDTTYSGGISDTSMGTWSVYNDNMVTLKFNSYTDTFKVSSLDGSNLVLRVYADGMDYPFYDGYTKY